MRHSKAQTITPQPEPKLKKVPSGPVREKTRTMNKLILAVGKVLQKKGYAGLTIGNISTEAEVDKKLIYLYFGNVNNLIETFLKQRDFWNIAEKGVVDEILQNPDELGKEAVSKLLQSQYNRFYKDKLFQKYIHWELGEKTELLRDIANTRAEIGEKLFERIEKDFLAEDIDLRSILALQMAGISYLVLHAKTNGSPFCGLDINKSDDKERVNKSIDYLVNLLYKQVNK